MTAAAEQRDSGCDAAWTTARAPAMPGPNRIPVSDDGARETRFGDDALRAAFRAPIPIGRRRVRAEHADQHDATDSGLPARIHDGLSRVDVGRLIARRGTLEENPGEMHHATRPRPTWQPVRRDRRSRSRALKSTARLAGRPRPAPIARRRRLGCRRARPGGATGCCRLCCWLQ